MLSAPTCRIPVHHLDMLFLDDMYDFFLDFAVFVPLVVVSRQIVLGSICLGWRVILHGCCRPRNAMHMQVLHVRYWAFALLGTNV